METNVLYSLCCFIVVCCFISVDKVGQSSCHVQKQHNADSQYSGLKKEFGLFTAVSAVVNMVLGSGLFYTPSIILSHTGSFGLSICLWVAGGVVSLCGALCYLEFALMVKKSGSTYIYIKEAYSFGRKKPWMEQFGSFCGFVVAWTNVIILQPLSHAVGALAFGMYVCRPFFTNCEQIPTLPAKFIALTLPSKSFGLGSVSSI